MTTAPASDLTDLTSSGDDFISVDIFHFSFRFLCDRSINIQGLSKSPECNLLQNQASPNTAPFRTETLILPAAGKVGQGQLTAESLSRNCPWLKRVTSSKVMPLWELRGHPLSNDWLIQEHKGPATWLQSGYFFRAIPALEARG